MEEFFSQVGQFFVQVWNIVLVVGDPRNLTEPDRFKAAFSQAGVFWVVLTAVALIVFTETGLLIGFLLPGDSLLVVLGIFIHLTNWDLWPFLLCLSAAAIVGDAVGYWIGKRTGPAIFNRPSSRFFKQEYLQRAKTFYEKHGGKTIIIARFVPIVRTFVPVVAGASKMEYRTFLFYNVFGGIGWVTSMILFGYFLIPIADPPMQALLGKPNFTWAKNIDKVVVVVIALSVLPMVWKAGKHWLEGRKAADVAAEAVTAVPPEEPTPPAPLPEGKGEEDNRSLPLADEPRADPASGALPPPSLQGGGPGG